MPRFLLAISVLLVCFMASPAQAAEADLGLTGSDISFSTKKLVTGDHIRLYAEIHNHGTVDVAGYVLFYQGAIPIGQSQVISVRADGVAEEVYVDFVVPAGSFNIRADIKGTDPQDENPANDSAMTGLFTPVLDQDHDEIEDGKDNCVSTKNGDQADADKDGKGDACDEDDDNDGLSDEVEREIGTMPTVADSDGDGVNDKDDAFPLDPTKSKVPPPVPVAPAPAPPKPLVKGETSTTPVVTAVAQAAPVVAEPEEEQAEEPKPEPSSVNFSPAAVFSWKRLSWNTFEFKALTPFAPGYRFEWSLGDGVVSNRHTLEHAYATSGDYAISLTVTDPDGKVTKDEAVVSVPFFTLENRAIQALVAILGLMLLIGLIVLIRIILMGRKEKQDADDGVPTHVSSVDLDVASDEEVEDEEDEEEEDGEGEEEVEEPVAEAVVEKPTKPSARKLRVRDEG